MQQRAWQSLKLEYSGSTSIPVYSPGAHEGWKERGFIKLLGLVWDAAEQDMV